MKFKIEDAYPKSKQGHGVYGSTEVKSTSKQQTVLDVIFYAFNGITALDIAEKTGICRSTVYVNIRDLRNKGVEIDKVRNSDTGLWSYSIKDRGMKTISKQLTNHISTLEASNYKINSVHVSHMVLNTLRQSSSPTTPYNSIHNTFMGYKIRPFTISEMSQRGNNGVLINLKNAHTPSMDFTLEGVQ